MPPVKDLTGKKFGKLTVIRRNGYKFKDRYVAWLCKCECGRYTTQSGVHLRTGRIKSCGCSQYKWGHGLTYHPIFKVWQGMMRRCGHTRGATKQESRLYIDRGIKVCREWRLDPKIFIIWAKENGYKKGLCIDREDTYGNYKPDNCRFVTNKVNTQNSIRSKRWHVKGKWYPSLRDAAKDLNLSYERIRQMCQGYTSYEGYTYKPKEGCRVVDLY